MALLQKAAGTEGFLHVLVDLVVFPAHGAGLTHEDLEEDDEDESPAGHVEGEAFPEHVNEAEVVEREVLFSDTEPT